MNLSVTKIHLQMLDFIVQFYATPLTIVEIGGTKLWGSTDDKGYFEIPGIPQNPAGYKIIISKPGYLSRYIDSAAFTEDMKINGETSPINIWAGDVLVNTSQDGAINLADIVTVARAFNSIQGDSRYVKEYDFNSDGVVNMADIMIIAKHFNTTAKNYPKCTVPLPSSTPAPTSTPTPALITVQGKLVWNDFEGGFYGVVGNDGTKYDIGNGSSEINGLVGAIIEISGYAHPDMMCFHQWGTIFEVVSYKPMSTPIKPTPTPTKARPDPRAT